eukprot:scaffold45106_cov29-Prasinocladus_malaysianus.AAC.2
MNPYYCCHRQLDGLNTELEEDAEDLGNRPEHEHHTTFEAVYEILPSRPRSLPREDAADGLLIIPPVGCGVQIAADAPRRVHIQPGPEVSHLPPDNPPRWFVRTDDEQSPLPSPMPSERPDYLPHGPDGGGEQGAAGPLDAAANF